jgi:hypothetical protein
MIERFEELISFLELGGDGAVDEEVGGEVEHDQQVRHAFCHQGEDPQTPAHIE